MKEEYGYCRISRPKQSIERQVRNILDLYPNAYIVKEVFTGTKIEGRNEWNKLYNMVKKDIGSGKEVRIIFDSVSRMSRNEEEGFLLYKELYEMGVELIFIKEPHINTETYKKALDVDIKMTGTNADILLKAIKEYLIELAKEQIRLAFIQSEKEVMDLRKRTSEGLKTAKLNGKQVGRINGNKYPTKKEKKMKEIILRTSKDFNGANTDVEVMQLTGISRNTFYKYKKQLMSSFYIL